MTVSESYSTIHPGGLSNITLLENWYYVFRNKNLLFWKQCFSHLT